MLPARQIRPRVLTIGLAAILVGATTAGALYTRAHFANAPIALEASSIRPSAAAKPGREASGSSPTANGEAATPGTGAAVGAQTFGEVTSIAADPPGFTVHLSNGADATYLVLETTIFDAGRDRPYRFDLLKVGDGVKVKAGRPVQQAGRTAKKASNRAASPAASPDSPGASQELVARSVTVRPAGEQRQGSSAKPGGRPSGSKKGVRNAPLQ